MKRLSFQKLLEATNVPAQPCCQIKDPRSNPFIFFGESEVPGGWNRSLADYPQTPSTLIFGDTAMAFISTGYDPKNPWKAGISDIGPHKIQPVFPARHRRELPANGPIMKSPEPGVLLHVSESGAKVTYCVRCGGAPPCPSPISAKSAISP